MTDVPRSLFFFIAKSLTVTVNVETKSVRNLSGVSFITDIGCATSACQQFIFKVRFVPVELDGFFIIHPQHIKSAEHSRPTMAVPHSPFWALQPQSCCSCEPLCSDRTIILNYSCPCSKLIEQRWRISYKLFNLFVLVSWKISLYFARLHCLANVCIPMKSQLSIRKNVVT